MGRAHAREFHEELFSMGGNPHWGGPLLEEKAVAETTSSAMMN